MGGDRDWHVLRTHLCYVPCCVLSLEAHAILMGSPVGSGRWVPSRRQGWDSNPGSLALKPVAFPLSQAALAASPVRWLWVLLCFSHLCVAAVTGCHTAGVRQGCRVGTPKGSEPQGLRSRTQKHSPSLCPCSSDSQQGGGGRGCPPLSPPPLS